MAFQIKQGDTRPFFVVVLKDDFGEATESVVDLTTATSVAFNMRMTTSPNTVRVSRGAGTISNRPGGEVTYKWGTADTATAGSYEAEVEVLWNDGRAETFPSNGYWPVTIADDIA